MAKLNEELLDKIAAKVIEKGEPDDLAKYILASQEAIKAVQRYFNHLEAYKKKYLTLKDNHWAMSFYYGNAKTDLPLFKLFASSIIPFVEELRIENIQLDDYSFLNNIKHLEFLWLEFVDREYVKVLSALSSLESVNRLHLLLKNVNLQFLTSLPFSFNALTVLNFNFDADPKCDKIFQTTSVRLCGDRELKKDFVFTRENYQNYAAIFPNANHLRLDFYIKIFNDFCDLLKVASPNYYDEVKVSNRSITFSHKFFDYSGRHSELLRVLQGVGGWVIDRCPYEAASTRNNGMYISCRFHGVGSAVGYRLAKKSLRRIPEGSNGSPEDYHRLTIENDWGHKAEFEILKTTSIKDLLKAYGKITRLDPKHLCFKVDHRWISRGIVGRTFQKKKAVFITFC